jgi:hypothetical protein
LNKPSTAGGKFPDQRVTVTPSGVQLEYPMFITNDGNDEMITTRTNFVQDDPGATTIEEVATCGNTDIVPQYGANGWLDYVFTLTGEYPTGNNYVKIILKSENVSVQWVGPYGANRTKGRRAEVLEVDDDRIAIDEGYTIVDRTESGTNYRGFVKSIQMPANAGLQYVSRYNSTSRTTKNCVFWIRWNRSYSMPTAMRIG